MAVQNELVAAYNELRDELAQEKWQKNYVELDQEQQDAIRDIYPQRISEAEPKSTEKEVMGNLIRLVNVNAGVEHFFSA